MHKFVGKWITDEDFANVLPRDSFYQHSLKMLRWSVKKDKQHNCHVLFRKKFMLNDFSKATAYITADDFYKLYINGVFVATGPVPSYKWAYRYNTINITKYLKKGENTIAVHTYYQGLVNRYIVSGDLNHGLLLDIVADGKTVVASNDSFLTARHTAYSVTGMFGYMTCYREDYNSNSPETGFEREDYDDSAWHKASYKKYDNYKLQAQKSHSVVFESISPKTVREIKGGVQLDFGKSYVGYLNIKAKGTKGDKIVIKCAQELDEDGNARYILRTSKVEYLENWTLSGNEDSLNWFDYKVFRYVDIELPQDCEIYDISLTARHYPFKLKAKMSSNLIEACNGNKKDLLNLKRIWKLCVNTLHYGPQESIHDCMDRERGTYLADVGLAAFTQSLLTKDPSLLRLVIDDGFSETPIIDTLGAGTCCSLIHNTAEYPLIYLRFVYFYYCLTHDKVQLAKDYEKMKLVLDGYRRDYEVDNLLAHIDKWCVVEWPEEYRDGYDANLDPKEIEEDTHVVLNMHYYKAIQTANTVAKILGLEPYRDEKEVGNAIIETMYDKERHLFKDSTTSNHVSYIGNLYQMAFGLIPDNQFRANMEKQILEKKVSAVNEFGPFPILEYFAREKKYEELKEMLLDKGAWLNMLKEGATTTFEAWGAALKWNTSLFHNSLAYAAIFLSDADLNEIFA